MGRMEKLKILSVRKKFFISMVLFSLLSVVIVTSVALLITYATMKNQVIANHRMSAGWLQSRLALEIEAAADEFYDLEVDPVFKREINAWYELKEAFDYSGKNKLITKLNQKISMDSKINAIEIHNFSDRTMVNVERAKATFDLPSEALNQWLNKAADEQTNLVFSRETNEILIAHQMNRFTDKAPLALVIVRIRPYALQDILEDIRTTEQETILVFNQENELIEGLYGLSELNDETVLNVIGNASDETAYETVADGMFWFYRSVGGGKLKILQAVPNKTIMLALNKTLLGGLFAAILSVMISLVFSVVLSHVISKPIIRLANDVRDINLNETHIPVQSDRRDEIGYLHESFDVMLRRNRDLIVSEYQSEINKKDAQLRALQAQINPHFMYNTLQVIGGMALKKGVSEVYHVTVDLSDILRYSLNFSKEMVKLKEEIKYMNSYLSIQNQRFGNRITFENEIPEPLLDYLVPKLILQPLIENSFEHGLSNKSGPWIIKLYGAENDAGDLLLTVIDNGLGVSPEKLNLIREELAKNVENALNTGIHIGLGNVHSRIRLINSDKKYGVTIDSIEGEGTTVKVMMKAQKEVENAL